jgi:glutamyl-tRNA reductase
MNSTSFDGRRALCLISSIEKSHDCTVVPETLVNCDDIKRLMEARRHSPLLLIDLSVPRNIDAAVADVDGVSLYNIDDLEGMAREGIRNREREVAACYEIIDAYVAEVIKKLNAGIERVHAGDKNDPLLRQEFTTALTPLLQPI